MPLYEYRCRACGETFERLRPAAEADDAAPCSRGHDDTTRLLSLIAEPSGDGGSQPQGGACCAGGCGCA